jgi:hypothetical protein
MFVQVFYSDIIYILKTVIFFLASIPTRETYKDYGHASGFSDEAYDSGSDSYSGQESTMSETDSLMDIGILICLTNLLFKY